MPSKTAAKKKEKKEKFSLVPIAAQRRIYELAYRAIIVRELLGYAGEHHSDFAEIGALTALPTAEPVFPGVHSVGARVARAQNLSEIAAAIAELRQSHPLSEVSDTLAPNERMVPQIASSLMHHPERMAVVSTGEVVDRGAWESVLRFAGRHRLPILFIVTAHYQSRHERSTDLRSIYAEFGIPVITVDANDAIAAYRVATESAHNAHAGRGATVLEASLILTSNNGINSQAPLDHLEEYMRSRGAWDDAWHEQVAARAEAELKFGERSA